MAKTYVGFGFGPIQAGLFLLEASRSNRFSRLVVAEVDKSVVLAVRRNGGTYTVNVATRERIEGWQVAGVEILDPAEPCDREKLIAAVAESSEMATCLPSVNCYDVPGPASISQIIADGLARRSAPFPTVIYTAENHNRAAELLLEAVAARLPAQKLASVRTVNTVIGKMSGTVSANAAIMGHLLSPVAPGSERSILVEEFNKILIERVSLPGWQRRIGVFVEKDDLLPFEEAKLYGHNAVHALIGYLAASFGLKTIAEAGRNAWIMQTARRAFVHESGAALVKRHASLGDSLFTPGGFRAYAEDLLERMANPLLDDRTSRVCRDPLRKLGYHDRLFGAMRLAVEAGVASENLALGAAAGVVYLMGDSETRQRLPYKIPARPESLSERAYRDLLFAIWAGKADEQADALVSMTWQAHKKLCELPDAGTALPT